MHEISLCEALIDQVEKEVERCGQGGRVVGVEVVIGRLSGVHPDSLRFAFELLVPGTFLEEAELTLAESKATCYCRQCDGRAEIDGLPVECPQCHSGDITIEGGRELLLSSIEIEDPT